MAKQENYLDYIPKQNSLYEYTTNDKKHVEIRVQNKGLFNRIAQLFFKRPKYSSIELDDFGTYVWNSMDGKATIYDIGKKVKAQFGEAAEPLYERLSHFMQTLHSNGFIVYVNKLKKKQSD